MRLVNWRTLVVAAAGMGLAACGDDVVVQPPTLIATPSSPSVTCTAGGQVAAGVTVSGGSGASTVTFSGGTGVTVTGNGTTVTIACGTTPGASSVTYTVVNGSQTVTGSIPITIQAAPSPVLAVSITPQALTVPVGGTGVLTASVSLATGAPVGTATTVTWSSTDPTIATVNATTGVVTGVRVGQTTIRATSTANTNLTASIPVTVTGTSALVGALNVTPQNISTTVGGTSQLTTQVTLQSTAPAGTSTAVICRSASTTIATVTSSGCAITGVAAGTTTITILAAADTNVRTTVGVTVGAQAPVRLTIQNFRVVNAQGNQVPADLNNVAGNLFVTLNLDPGDFRPDSVRVRLGSQTILCQRFSAQLAQAFRDAITTGSSDVQPIECQLNTAQFDTLTGNASVQNGQQNLTAEVFFRPQNGGASTTQSATINQALTLNNQAGFYVAVTNTPTAAQVANGGPANGQRTGPQGVLWRAGTINVTILPVSFVNNTPTNAGLSLTVSLVDNNNVVATKNTTATQGAAITATFPGATAPYTAIPVTAGTVTGYTSPNAGTPTGGTRVVIGGGANAVILNQVGAVVGNAPTIYIDNSSPEARAQTISTNFLFGGAGNAGFLSGAAGTAFVFADSIGQAAATTPLADNNGVDLVSRTFFFASNTAANGTAANVVANGTSVLNATTITPSATQTTYRAAARLADALGNAVAVDVAPAGAVAGTIYTFGVDVLAPTLNVTGVTNGAAGATQPTIATSVTDNVGFGQNPITAIVQQTTAAGTFCAQAPTAGTVVTTIDLTTPVTAGSCAAVNATAVGLTGAGNTRAGVYTVTIQARDVAGNLSAPQTFTYTVESQAPQVTNPVVVTSPLVGNAAATFRGTYRDSVRVDSIFALMNYTGVGSLRYDNPTASNPSGLTTNFGAVNTGVNATVTVPNFIRAIATATGAAAARIAGFQMGGTNAAGLNGFSVQAPIGTEVLPAFVGTTFSAANTFTVGFTNGSTASVAACTAATAGCQVSVGGANPAAGTPSTGTFTISYTNGTAASFASPFSRIEVWYADPASQVNGPGSLAAPAVTPVWRMAGVFGTETLTVTPVSATRTASFSFSIPANLAASATNAGTAVQFMVLGINANGDALQLAAPATLGIFR